jgi:hypothetical protein
VLDDELMRKKASSNKKKRAIDLELLSNVMMLLAKFLYAPRHQRTIAEALVGCLFNVINEKFPGDFGSPL